MDERSPTFVVCQFIKHFQQFQATINLSWRWTNKKSQQELRNGKAWGILIGARNTRKSNLFVAKNLAMFSNFQQFSTISNDLLIALHKR